MYELLKRIIFPLLKVEETQPEPPAGYDPHEHLTIMRATPAYLRYRLLFWKIKALLIVAIAIAASVTLLLADLVFLWLVVPILLLGAFQIALLYVTARLDYEMRWYVVTDRSLLIRQGVWVVREITLTFANAQNVHVKQGPLQRLFGFANVEVDTAGGGGKKGEEGIEPHRAVLRGVADPATVRDMILDVIRRHRTAGLGDPDDHLHEEGLEPHAMLVHRIWEEARLLRHGAERLR